MVDNRIQARSFFNGLYEVGERHAYLSIKGGDIVNQIIGAPGVDKAKEIRVMDIDGVPTTVLVCKKRYMSALLKCRTYSQLYNYLLQKFAENDIREYMYEIWIGYHNVKARKMIRLARCQANEMRKKGYARTEKRLSPKRMSIRQAAKEYGAL